MHKLVHIFLLTLLLTVGLGAAYFGYDLYVQNRALSGTVFELQDTLDTTKESAAELEHFNASLSDALTAEQQKAAFLEEQASTFAAAVQKMTGKVTTLEKRSKLDPELLIKYSKVYFLNEHYIPEKLTIVSSVHTHDGREEYIHTNTLPYLEHLLTEAKNSGMGLKVISAFRSFETQKDLKSKYSVTYGIGANTFSADQGYSEHQLGTTVDFTTLELGKSFTKFDDTSAYLWLKENAHRFGFVLSYPEGNTHYVYEPWHWRFAGIKLATKLH